MSNCKIGSDNEELLVEICIVVSAILGNADLYPLFRVPSLNFNFTPTRNASGTISKLDQLAVFAQLQNIPHTSPALQPVLHLAHSIVTLRQDTANLHGELAMCVPQIISIACSSTINPDAQSLALDFIAHISVDSQHASTLVESGIIRPLVLQLGQTPHTKPTSGSGLHVLVLQVLSTLLSSLIEEPPSFATACSAVVSAGGVPAVCRFVVPPTHAHATTGEPDDKELACEWAAAILADLSRDGDSRSVVVEHGLNVLVSVATQSGVSTRVAEGTLVTISSLCGQQQHYLAALESSRAVAAVALHLDDGANNLVSLALKCVIQLVKDPTGRELLKAHNVDRKLQTLTTKSDTPTISIASQKILALLQT